MTRTLYISQTVGEGRTITGRGIEIRIDVDNIKVGDDKARNGARQAILKITENGSSDIFNMETGKRCRHVKQGIMVGVNPHFIGRNEKRIMSKDQISVVYKIWHEYNVSYS